MQFPSEKDGPVMSDDVKSEATSVAAAVSTHRLKSLQRGEASAVGTYRQAMERGGSGAASLAPLLREHREAADDLRLRIRSLGGEPDASAGVWGDFTAAFEGTANLFGSAAALMALKTGEEHGTRQYEEALTDETLDVASKEVIRARLLPRQGEHVAVLEALLRNR